METIIGAQKPIAIVILSLILITASAEGVGAASFFDGNVVLGWKADARLKSALPDVLRSSHGKVSVLVVFSSVPTPDQLQALRSLGTIRTFTGHVATVDLDSAALVGLASLGFVERISKPRILKSELDVSVPDILAERAWNQETDSEGNPIDGFGVVVGIVDSGIDYLHKDFMFRNGTNKILYIWDQSIEGRPPSLFDYGNECSPADIREQICSEVDGGSNGLEVGHGTAVAAVAASTGQATSLFDSCLLFDGARWVDETSKCQTFNSNPLTLPAKPADYMYFGSVERFNKINFNLAVAGNYGLLAWEYSAGAGSWTKLANDTIVDKSGEQTFVAKDDGTAGLTQNGTFAFSPPVGWVPDTVNSVSSMYWIRLNIQKTLRPAMAYEIKRTPSYVGVAPGASIVAVKLRDGSEDHVLDGMSYVIQKARELGLPLVIDHSLGDSLGSHDGTESLEIAMTDLVQDGVPIVVAAGNSRNLDLHTSGKLSSGDLTTVFWSLPEDTRANYIDLWYSISDNIGITVQTPSGFVVYGPTSEFGVSTPDGVVQILSESRSSGNEWWINVTSASGRDLQSSPWSFTLAGDQVSGGRWDAWTEPGQFTRSENSVYIIDPQDTIDSPGTAKGVITVGSYMTRLFWRSGCSACIVYSLSQGKHGIWWTAPLAPDVGALTYSSGMGPTRDGRTKPELVAPGAHIISARASSRQQRNSDPDNFHQVWRGTSFATPHVVGVIAMMLQVNPQLSPSAITSILTQGSREDRFTGEIDRTNGSPLWGWGKVNALQSTQDSPNLYSVRLEVKPVRGDFAVSLNLDGKRVLTIPLNEPKTLILDFNAGETHTIDLNPAVINVSPGVRYVVSGTPWEFSAGGTREFDYVLQYYLDVTTRFGNASGTGWYIANSTATVTVDPTVVTGFRFQGWSGSINSASPTVTITMDSEKHVAAEWREAASPTIASFLIAALAVIGIVGVASVTILSKTGRFNLAWVRKSDRTRRLRRILSES